MLVSWEIEEAHIFENLKIRDWQYIFEEKKSMEFKGFYSGVLSQLGSYFRNLEMVKRERGETFHLRGNENK